MSPRLPVVAAPMLGVSGPDLVTAALRAGISAAFPTANCHSTGELTEWIDRIGAASVSAGLGSACANLIVHQSNPRLHTDAEAVIGSPINVVITSVGAPPADLVSALHAAGQQVWADVASMRHVDRCLAAGVDGLVLLTAGAGGQTGWMNPIAFTRAVRRIYDGIVVLAGGIADGASVAAAQMLGADLAYCGTRFVATRESIAPAAHKRMVVNCGPDQVVLTDVVTGIPASILEPSLGDAGSCRAEPGSAGFQMQASLPHANGNHAHRDSAWSQAFSAGHAVYGVDDVMTVAAVVAQMEREYQDRVGWPEPKPETAVHN